MSEQVEISVLVPTHGRRQSLERCLVALTRQAVDEPFEIVVVLDGADESTWVADLVAEVPNARLVQQTAKGPGAARNAAVAVARGSVVCFTDDDCEPGPRWVAELVEALRSGALAAAGITTNGQGTNQFATASQLVAEYFAEHATVPFAASNNLACKAELAREVPFDERFRNAAAEDRDWCARIAARGVVLRRVASARVEHHQRLSLRAFLAQQLRYGRGSHRYHRESKPARPFEARRFYVDLLRRGAAAGPRIALLVALSQLATALGFALAAVSRRR